MSGKDERRKAQRKRLLEKCASEFSALHEYLAELDASHKLFEQLWEIVTHNDNLDFGSPVFDLLLGGTVESLLVRVRCLCETNSDCHSMANLVAMLQKNAHLLPEVSGSELEADSERLQALRVEVGELVDHRIAHFSRTPPPMRGHLNKLAEKGISLLCEMLDRRHLQLFGGNLGFRRIHLLDWRNVLDIPWMDKSVWMPWTNSESPE